MVRTVKLRNGYTVVVNYCILKYRNIWIGCVHVATCHYWIVADFWYIKCKAGACRHCLAFWNMLMLTSVFLFVSLSFLPRHPFLVSSFIASDEEDPTTAGKVPILWKLSLFSVMPLIMETQHFQFKPQVWHSLGLWCCLSCFISFCFVAVVAWAYCAGLTAKWCWLGVLKKKRK